VSVYVDSLRHIRPSRRWPSKTHCHMWADSQLELFDMAEKLGLSDRWFQAHRRLPHFDLVASKRERALEMGALSQGNAEIVAKMKDIRFQQEWDLRDGQ